MPKKPDEFGSKGPQETPEKKQRNAHDWFAEQARKFNIESATAHRDYRDDPEKTAQMRELRKVCADIALRLAARVNRNDTLPVDYDEVEFRSKIRVIAGELLSLEDGVLRSLKYMEPDYEEIKKRGAYPKKGDD